MTYFLDVGEPSHDLLIFHFVRLYYFLLDVVFKYFHGGEILGKTTLRVSPTCHSIGWLRTGSQVHGS